MGQENAPVSPAELLLDIDDRGAVEDVQPRYLQAIAVNGQDLQLRDCDRVRPYRAAGGEDALQPSRAVAARVDHEDIAIGAMQPEQHDDDLTGGDAVESRLVLGIDLQGPAPVRDVIIPRGIVEAGDIAVHHPDDPQCRLFHVAYPA